jgi:demethylmenaquinone methyltransferase/2-methoxy-6-polyprenyl-1,4-benzoquinol methylase
MYTQTLKFVHLRVPSWKILESMQTTFTPQDDAAMRAYYDQRAGEYDEWYRREGRFAGRPQAARWHAEVAQLRERVRSFGHGRLLEIAAGTGWWTQHLARRARVIAVDYAPAMLAQLGARLRAEGLQAGRVRADAYRLPFAARSFDCGFFAFWLSHVPFARLPEFVGELRRVLRPGSEVMVLDSAPTEAGQIPGAEFLHERILNDNTRHAVLKILHTPATMAEALAPLGDTRDAWSTGTFFTGAVVRID